MPDEPPCTSSSGEDRRTAGVADHVRLLGALREEPASGSRDGRDFRMSFGATPRGARLARLLAVHQLGRWNVPRGSEPSATAALLVAELASNAVSHGCPQEPDFGLRLFLPDGDEGPARLRIEVTNARAGGAVAALRPVLPPADAGSGRGLALVAALATRWGHHDEGPHRTVWAELHLP